MKRQLLIRLLQVQALVGVAVLAWIFFTGNRVDDSVTAKAQLPLDTVALAENTLAIVRQKNHDLIVIKPSAEALLQLAQLRLPPKNTISEPPRRALRVTATLKVFVVARLQDQYLLSGRDYWQRDIACDDLIVAGHVPYDGVLLQTALICRRTRGDIMFDAAGRSLDASIADLEMPSYELRDGRVLIDNP